MAPQSGRIGWRPYANVVTQVVNAVDADATAFITAAGITNLTQASAINTLVNDLKTYGLWTKMKALYPMVGGSATSHKFNLKDPRDLDAAYRLVFNGGWTHTSNGALPNGTTGYADTKFINAQVYPSSITNIHVSYYSRTNTNKYEMIGMQDDSVGQGSQVYLQDNGAVQYYSALNTDANAIAVNKVQSSIGHYLTSRTSLTSLKGYRDGVIQGSNTTTSSGLKSTLPIIISGAIYKFSSTQYYYGNKECAFSSIGDGLTDTDATNFYNSVQKFQTTLGRQIGSPIVSDTDAQAFLNAAEITDLGQANAVNTLVVDLKAAGVWTKMKALYPFVGGTATSHKFNLKDPRDLNAAFRLTFNGGWTHTATGALPNGTTGYADTNLVPSSILSLNSTHVSYYSRTNISIDKTDFGTIGSSSFANNLYGYIKAIDGKTYFRVNRGGTPESSVAIADSRLFYMINRISLTQEVLFTNSNKTTFSLNMNSTGLSPYSIYLGAVNLFGTGASEYSPRESAFASIGDGLTDGEAAAFYTAVQKYQTSLGRQIGTPVLAEGQTAGLLETYSGAAAAYSLRKLRTGYVGFAIRVRRSSDNTEQDIAFNTSGGLDTVSLLAFVGAGNGFVTTWYDQSGNGKHAYQISASNQPRIVLGGAIDLINNKPSLKFTNGQMLVTTQNVLGTGNLPYSVYGVSYNNATADSTLFFLGADNLNVSNGYLSLQVNTNGGMTNFRHFWGTGFGWSPGLNVNNRQQYYYIGYDGSTKYSSVNNTDLTNTQVITINLQSPILKIGQLPQVSEYYKGYHQELILFNSNSSSTTTGVKSNINSYYSIY